MGEIFVSTDIEADGPIPGPHSMLSFASAAFERSGTLVSTFTANLETLEGAAPDEDTMRWWKTQPAAWAACRTDPQPPSDALPRYAQWLEALPGQPVFVAYPATYDFMFVHWYLMRFAGHSPFGHAGLDIKTYAYSLLNSRFRSTTKRNMPNHWFGPERHTHIALDDALSQGELFLRMLNDARHSE